MALITRLRLDDPTRSELTGFGRLRAGSAVPLLAAWALCASLIVCHRLVQR